MGFKVRSKPGGLFELIGTDAEELEEVNRFLESLQVRGLSPQTVRAYAFDMVSVCRWLAEEGKALRDLRQADLLAFIATQRSMGAQPSSINRRLTTCRLAYRFCTGEEMALGAGVTMPRSHYRGRGKDRDLGLHAVGPPKHRRLRVKTPRRVVEPLTREEVLGFLRSLRRYRDIALVHLMLLCGLRSREVLQLVISDALLDERQIRVQGKGDKERVLPLPDVLLQSLNDYLRLERPFRSFTSRLFVVLQGRRRGYPMTPAGVRSLFRQRRLHTVMTRANAHRFRHTFGADMARARVRLPVLQRMMGHADAKTTLQYIHLSMADIAAEYSRAVGEIQKRYRS